MTRKNNRTLSLRGELQTVMQEAIEYILDDYAQLFTSPKSFAEGFARDSLKEPCVGKDDFAAPEKETPPEQISRGRHKEGKVILSHLELLLKLHETYGEPQEGESLGDDGHYKKNLIREARDSLQGKEKN